MLRVFLPLKSTPTPLLSLSGFERPTRSNFNSAAANPEKNESSSSFCSLGVRQFLKPFLNFILAHLIPPSNADLNKHSSTFNWVKSFSELIMGVSFLSKYCVKLDQQEGGQERRETCGCTSSKNLEVDLENFPLIHCDQVSARFQFPAPSLRPCSRFESSGPSAKSTIVVRHSPSTKQKSFFCSLSLTYTHTQLSHPLSASNILSLSSFLSLSLSLFILNRPILRLKWSEENGKKN